MKLSTHFTLAEFEGRGSVPVACIANLAQFCGSVLEPIREKFGAQHVTSGYRPEAFNETTGGAHNSEHLYTPDRCAVDLEPVPAVSPQAVFDWIRNQPDLLYDQVILEHDKLTGNPIIVHVGFCRENPRQEALIGSTHGASGYTLSSSVKSPPSATAPATETVSA